MLLMYVSCVSVILKLCCSYFFMNVAKVDQGCCTCCTCFRSMLQAFVQDVSFVSRHMSQSFFIWMLHMFSHICCNSMFQMFQPFQSYATVSVFHVAIFLSRYCIYFTHMLQAYVLNILSVSNVCCIRVFHVASADRRH